jgi:hypothetical protein
MKLGLVMIARRVSFFTDNGVVIYNLALAPRLAGYAAGVF